MKFENGTTTIAFDESRFKYCCDLKNSLDAAREEGEIKGKIEAAFATAETMIIEKESTSKIIKYTGLSEQQIQELIIRMKL